MTVTADDLKAAVNTTDADSALLAACVTAAQALLVKYTEDLDLTVPAEVIPTEIYDRAWLAIAVDLFNQRKAPNGILNVQGDDGAVPVRVSADPFRSARPLLEKWVIEVGFA